MTNPTIFGWNTNLDICNQTTNVGGNPLVTLGLTCVNGSAAIM